MQLNKHINFITLTIKNVLTKNYKRIFQTKYLEVKTESKTEIHTWKMW